MSDALGYITGIGGLVANPISTLINNYHNEQLIREQNQWNLEQWNRENFYNSPEQQMKRLKSAGLNPNLMYGNGAGSLLSAPSPEIQASHTDAPEIDPLTLAQIRNLDSQSAKNNADARQTNELLPLNKEKLEVDVKHTTHLVELVDSEKSKTDAEVFLTNNLSNKARAEAMEHFENYRYLTRSLAYRLDFIRNHAMKEGYEATKLDVELDNYKEILEQTLDNLKAQHTLLQMQAFAARENTISRRAEVNSYSSDVSNRATLGVANLKLDSIIATADFKYKYAALSAQIERWDDMTTNERLDMLVRGLETAAEVGSSLYTGSRVTETVQKSVGGGKPSRTTTTYSRQRAAKSN